MQVQLLGDSFYAQNYHKLGKEMVRNLILKAPTAEGKFCFNIN